MEFALAFIPELDWQIIAGLGALVALGAGVGLWRGLPGWGLRTLALGLTFAWNSGGIGVDGRVVEIWRNDTRKGDQARVSFYYDQKIVAATAACKMADVLT